MQIKPALRKATELGIGLTAITALILAGCGGGGSTSSGDHPVAAVKISTVTPGKGKMVGAVVSIKAADGTTVLGSKVTSSAGTAEVSIAATATGPFIVSVSCPLSCTYYDEKSGNNLAGSETAPAMLAVVPSAADLNIGVTAATNAAAQYAIASGALTPTSVLAANTAVGTLLNLGSTTNILTPPTIISSPATFAAAKGGTSAADKLASYSAAMSMAASGVTAIQAIADYGTAWKNAALVPASGVILPASIDSVLLTNAAPTFITTIPNVASEVAAATTAATSAVAAVNSWFAEVSVAGNSGSYWENSYYANAAAQASGVQTTDVYGWVDTVTVAGNTLTFSGSDKKLVGGAWVTNADPEVTYHLTSTGWVIGANGGTVVNNLDGTVTITPAGLESSVEKIARTDLSGTTITCNNATCTGTAKYPTGSIYTYSLETKPVDHYKLSSGSTQFPSKVTDMNGVGLTALPTGAFCVQEGVGAQIMKPIAAAPGADNFNFYGAWNCSAAEIANVNTYITNGGTPQGTALLTVHSTGNAVVTTVGMVTLTNATTLANYSWLNNKIVAVRAGKVYPGSRKPAGTFGQMDNQNKIAMTAYLAANGRPALP